MSACRVAGKITRRAEMTEVRIIFFPFNFDQKKKKKGFDQMAQLGFSVSFLYNFFLPIRRLFICENLDD